MHSISEPLLSQSGSKKKLEENISVQFNSALMSMKLCVPRNVVLKYEEEMKEMYIIYRNEGNLYYSPKRRKFMLFTEMKKIYVIYQNEENLFYSPK